MVSVAKKYDVGEAVVMSVCYCIFLLTVGIGLAFMIPILGWFVGLVCVVSAVMTPFWVRSIRTGNCPVCGADIKMYENHSVRCPRCRKVIYHKGSQFVSADDQNRPFWLR